MFGIFNKVYGILDLKMCRAGYTKKIVEIIWVKKYMGYALKGSFAQISHNTQDILVLRTK